MSKNRITISNSTYGSHSFSVLNSNEIFDREAMMNSIEAIEGKVYTYDDIRLINVVNLINIREINDLPHNLNYLEINKSTISRITIPRQCTKITTINIKETNLQEIPEISFLENLYALHIQKSFICKIPDQFPKSIREINLSENSLSEKNTDVTKFPKNIPIILFKNCFNEKPMLQNYGICWGSQYSSNRNNMITDYMVEHNYARTMITNALTTQQLIRDRQEELNTLRNGATHYVDYLRIENPQPEIPFEINARPVLNIIPRENVTNTPQIFNSSQTVHVTSICDSVTKSLIKIKELTNEIYDTSDDQQLIDELIYEFYKKPNPNDGLYTKIMRFFLGNNIQNQVMIGRIERWVDIHDSHTKSGMTYKELLARVWILIQNHEQKEDFITNVKIELESSAMVCFTGRFNRLVNSLIGFVDGVTVGISLKEQLQIEISKIIAKLGKGELSYNECKKNITELFEDENIKQDRSINASYKQSWIDALEDYKPDEEENKEENKEEEVMNVMHEVN